MRRTTAAIIATKTMSQMKSKFSNIFFRRLVYKKLVFIYLNNFYLFFYFFIFTSIFNFTLSKALGLLTMHLYKLTSYLFHCIKFLAFIRSRSSNGSLLETTDVSCSMGLKYLAVRP